MRQKGSEIYRQNRNVWVTNIHPNNEKKGEKKRKKESEKKGKE